MLLITSSCLACFCFHTQANEHVPMSNPAGLLSSDTLPAVVPGYYSPRVGIKMSPGIHRIIPAGTHMVYSEPYWFYCIVYLTMKILLLVRGKFNILVFFIDYFHPYQTKKFFVWFMLYSTTCYLYILKKFYACVMYSFLLSIVNYVSWYLWWWTYVMQYKFVG